MTADVIALCRNQPNIHQALEALLAAGPQLRVRAFDHGGLVQLCDNDENTLITIEGPTLVHTAGEAQRLLDPELASVPHPVWWIEAHAVRNNPAAVGIAHRLAETLTRSTGGITWPTR
jgi:hypothetical protein